MISLTSAFLAIALSTPALADGCENYCLGIRGNGEAVPATLTGMARMVEEFGPPKSMAGGSSATVAMFLQDTISGNSAVKAQNDTVKQRHMLGMMLKSMPEFMAAMAEDAKVADGFNMMQVFGGGDKAAIQKATEAFQNAGNLSPDQLQQALSKYGGLLNPELVALVKKDPARFGPEAVKSITNLGKFNAVTDDTLFFRPGLIDFKGFAIVMGTMADFYAGNTDPETKKKLEAWMADCSEKTYAKEWGDVPSECRDGLHQLAADYLKAGQFQHKAIFEKAGKNSESLPTTSLLQGDGVVKYNTMKLAYENGTAEKIEDFSINFDKDMAFGYWGKQSALDAVDSGLQKYRDQGDLRAKKFRSLGPASWFEVLATSPAEPGIANCQKMLASASREQILAEAQKPIDTRWSGLRYRKDVLSCGGWDDLQPTMVERARGCRPTLFLTRHAVYGDSKFGQQILVRFTGTKKELPFWEKIGESGPAGWCDSKIKEAGGNPDQVKNTPWNRLSNLCNAESSFRRALDLADGVYCTDWDNPNLDVFKRQMRPLMKDAYDSPLIPTSANGAWCKLNRQPGSLDPRSLPGCLPFPKAGMGIEGRDGAGSMEPAR